MTNTLATILLSAAFPEASDHHFPPTELYNEGWMLRLILHEFQRLGIPDHPISFAPGARWYSEARLPSPFAPRHKGDPLGEGSTHADNVVGHFEFRNETTAGLQLLPDATQFVVLEAKMGSNLASGTRNAPGYHQAARNIACMAKVLQDWGKPLDQLTDVGFYVVAPAPERRSQRGWKSNLEDCLTKDSIRDAVNTRIEAYGDEANKWDLWRNDFIEPLLEKYLCDDCRKVVTWDDCISAIEKNDAPSGQELQRFYERCLALAKFRRDEEE